MNIATILGLVIGFGALLASVVIEGGELVALLNVSGALIVFGGTFGAALVSFPLERVLVVPKLIARTLGGGGLEPERIVLQLVELADKARRQGLLSLEEEEGNITDPFMKKGIMLVVDGVDPAEVRHILETETHLMAERHAQGYSILEAMGGYAPTMGIIGTVMGLVHVLSNLEDPSELGAAIAVAFIATLYGVASANLVWLPLGSKLKESSAEEVLMRKIMTEGILAIQAGDNPHIVRQKLEAYLPPSIREKINQASGEGA
ncbi:MAG: flagellar motor protein [Chloroflexi bacterium]|nr:flagellar motor protein [Chloroflexota bacterium]